MDNLAKIERTSIEQTLEAVRELHDGGGKSFDSVEDLMVDLGSDDEDDQNADLAQR